MRTRSQRRMREADKTDKETRQRLLAKLVKAVRDYHWTQGHSMRETLHRFGNYPRQIIRDIVLYRFMPEVMDIEFRGARVYE